MATSISRLPNSLTLASFLSRSFCATAASVAHSHSRSSSLSLLHRLRPLAGAIASVRGVSPSSVLRSFSQRGFLSSASASCSSTTSRLGYQFDRSRLVSPSPFGKCGLLGGQKRGLKALCRFKGKSAGRNSSGRITIFHRGGGAKRLQRTVDLKRSTPSIGIVEREEYDPNRSSRIALVRWTKGVHLPRQRSNTMEEFAPPCKIVDPTTTAIRGLFSFSSLPGIREVNESKKTWAKDIFLSAFSSPKAKGDMMPLFFPRIAVAGANPAFLAPRMREKLKGEDTSPCEVQKWRPHDSILWTHRLKRKAALSWQSSRQQTTLPLVTHGKTAAAKRTATQSKVRSKIWDPKYVDA